MINRTYKSLKKTRNSLFNAVSLITGKKKLDDDLIDKFEEKILLCDIGFDVTEEIVRLTSHLKFFKSLFRQNQPVGRKLSFTLQEILREVNTLGSKASNEVTTRNVIEIKEEIEKIKEQVLNIL